jgi:predicted TIM-barrel enzyme
LTPQAWNAPSLKDCRIFLGEVVSDDANQTDVRKEAGRHRKICRRAAEDAARFAEGGFDGVERHRAYDE